MITNLVRFISILIAALLAGVSFGIWIGFNPADLSPAAFVEQQQNMLRSLRVMMVGLVLGATVATLVLAYLHRKEKAAFIALIIASAFFVACILITRLGNNPIDDLIMTWTPETLPSNWMALRDNWWSLHGWRTFTEVAALSIISWVSIRKEQG